MNTILFLTMTVGAVPDAELAKARAIVAVEVAKAQLPHQCPAGICKGKCNCVEMSRCGPGYCPTTIPAPLPPKVTITYQPSHGHTHSCAAGHIWDHTMDGGSHRCPICGLPPANRTARGGYPQEYSPVVTVQKRVQELKASTPSIPSAPVAMPVAPPIVKASPPLYQPFGEWKSNNPNAASFGGCANGSCGAPQRAGLFRRW